MTTLVIQHPERLWLAVLSLVLVAALLWRGLRGRSVRRGAAGLAVLCKLGVAALLALLLTDPVWSRKQPKSGENEVILLADNSASMNVAETPGGRTRGDLVREALGGGSAGRPSWMEKLGLQFRLNQQLVHERLEGASDFSGLGFEGRKSELHRALGTLLKGGPGTRTAAVVLVTDGLATDEAALAGQAGKSVPVFPVIVGESAPATDLGIVEHSVAQTAFEDTPATVTARISASGWAGREAAVLVLDESGKALVTEKVRLGRDDEIKTVRLKLPALKPGIGFYRLLTLDARLAGLVGREDWKPKSGEAVLANNERHLVVDRGSGPYRVLYLSGRPNWEYKFMRRALAADPEVQVPTLIRIARREPKFEWRGRTGETSNPLFRGFGEQGAAQRYDQPVLIRLGTKDALELADGFPKSAEQLFGEYRAVIIDDIEADFFTQEQMNLIERFVSERGGALLTLGGQESYQPGGYEHTPVGRMLPLYLDRVTSAPAVENARFDLTREGWLEPWARVRSSREDDEARLASMPGFFAVNQTFSIKPGASVLATVKAGDEAASSWPALVAQRFGEGRVVSVTVADLWRWGMRDDQARVDFEKAWRQLMRWLVVDVPDRIQVSTMPAGDLRRLEVRVRNASFQPQDDTVVRIEVTGPDGGKSEIFAEPSLKEAGLFEAEHHARAAGAHRAEVRVRTLGPDGRPQEAVESRQTGWVHDPQAAEFARLRPGIEWAENLASLTGGRVLKLQDLPGLPEILKDIRAPVEETRSTPLWHTPWFFGLVLALLGSEWALRRRGGLP